MRRGVFRSNRQGQTRVNQTQLSISPVLVWMFVFIVVSLRQNPPPPPQPLAYLGMLMSLFRGLRDTLEKATLIPTASNRVKEITPPIT